MPAAPPAGAGKWNRFVVGAIADVAVTVILTVTILPDFTYPP